MVRLNRDRFALDVLFRRDLEKALPERWNHAHLQRP